MPLAAFPPRTAKLPPHVEYKSFHFEVKSIDEDKGIICGYLSIFGNEDRQEDKVWKGAFTKTIQERQKTAEQRGKKAILPFLWMHDPEQPIGYYFTLEEDPKGLYSEAQLDITTNSAGIPNNALAVKVFSGYKQGYIDEQSIGYEAIKKDRDQKTGVRNLREIRLYEGSAVTMLWAANPEAIATDVKSVSSAQPAPDTKQFDDHYNQFQAADVIEDWSLLTTALYCATMDAFLIGNQPLDDAQEALNQFSIAYKEWVQKGITYNLNRYLTDVAADAQSIYGTYSGTPSYDPVNSSPSLDY